MPESGRLRSERRCPSGRRAISISPLGDRCALHRVVYGGQLVSWRRRPCCVRCGQSIRRLWSRADVRTGRSRRWHGGSSRNLRDGNRLERRVLRGVCLLLWQPEQRIQAVVRRVAGLHVGVERARGVVVALRQGLTGIVVGIALQLRDRSQGVPLIPNGLVERVLLQGKDRVERLLLGSQGFPLRL